MHPSRLRLGPSQSRPLIDASPGSVRSPGLRVCRAAPSRRRNIHTHAPFRTEGQSFLRCRDMRLTISRKQQGRATQLPSKAEATGSTPVGPTGSRPAIPAKCRIPAERQGRARRVCVLATFRPQGWSWPSAALGRSRECANSGHVTNGSISLNAGRSPGSRRNTFAPIEA